MTHNWLDIIETNSTRLAALVAEDPDAKVPACPDWTARDLLVHLAEVQRLWAVTTARAGGPPVDMTHLDAPPDGQLTAHAAHNTTALLDAYRAAGPAALT